MSPYPRDLWERACKTILTARREMPFDHDACAAIAYYAAFYAVSALFAVREREFTKHEAVEAAVHKDLVRPGTWPAELGAAYSDLRGLRHTGNYGGSEHVSPERAKEAVQIAERILRRVSESQPADFPLPPELGA